VFLRAELALREGRLVDARQCLEDALVQHGDISVIVGGARFMCARVDLLSGRPEAALPTLRAQVEENEPSPGLPLLPYLAEAYLGSGEVARAQEVVARAIASSRAAGDRRTLIEALRVHALILVREARSAEARQALDEALSIARSIGTPWEEGRVLALLDEIG
jgi:tetratricopeptide (TPR) repeat protein